jgi:uncharacterized membrane protein
MKAAQVAIVAALYVLVHAALEAGYVLLCGRAYMKMVERVQCGASNTRRVRYLYAVLAYVVFFAATFYVLVLPTLLARKWWYGAVLGAAYGAAVYGVFNLTNLFLFRHYDLRIACVDMAYGVASLALIGALASALAIKAPARIWRP